MSDTPIDQSRPPTEVRLFGDTGMPWRPVSPKLATARLLVLGVFLVPLLLALVVLALLVWTGFWVGAALVALALAAGAWLIRRQVPAITWAEGAEELVVRRGRMFRTLVSVPYGRLQFVDVQSGPLERRFDMATVELHTASPQSGGQIPGLPTAEAEALRERLAARGESQRAGSVSAVEPTPTPATEPAPEPEWRHLHPLSPLLKGGIAFIAVLAYVVSQQADSFFGAQRDDPTQGHLGWAAIGVVVVLLGIIAGAWVSWRFSRFRVAASLIELRTGVLFRQHRQVRFDRIQAVDLGRPLLARLTGLSEVVVQSAGGKDSHLKLSFLTDAQAQEVREQLMALAGRSDEVARGDGSSRTVSPAGAPGWRAEHLSDEDYADLPAPPPVGQPILAIPNTRILQSILYSGPGLVIVLALPALVLSVALGVPEMVAWLGPMTLAVGSSHLKRLTQECNFELLHQGDRLRIRHGLTDLRTTTVPLHRIQAVEVSQSLPWRLTGWWRIQVNVAGAGAAATTSPRRC